MNIIQLLTTLATDSNFADKNTTTLKAEMQAQGTSSEIQQLLLTNDTITIEKHFNINNISCQSIDNPWDVPDVEEVIERLNNKVLKTA